MIHHVSVGVTNVARAATFYDPVLGALGYKRIMDFSPGAIAYGERSDRPEFWIGLPHDQRLPSAGNGTHIGFAAKSRAAVDKFHTEALKAGGSNGGEPGPRPDYGPGYYGAFIYDLDGNKIEATLIEVAPKAKAAPAKKASKKTVRKPAKAKHKARRKGRK